MGKANPKTLKEQTLGIYTPAPPELAQEQKEIYANHMVKSVESSLETLAMLNALKDKQSK